MSLASKTYVITNGNPNDGSQVEQDFNDLIGFINASLPHSDGTGGAADIRGLVAALGADQNRKFHLGGPANQTTDSSGYKTVTHGAGFTPVWVFPSINETGGITMAGIYGTDTYTSTTFRIRLVGVSAPVTVSLMWMVIA